MASKSPNNPTIIRGRKERLTPDESESNRTDPLVLLETLHHGILPLEK